jgi:GDP-4-dehydro-6-deoxy-D-mannose reductase
MRALIIGGSGFVGSHLSTFLKEKLCCETVLTSSKNENVQFRHLDVLSTRSVEEALRAESPDLIFYLAAQSSVKLGWNEPVRTSEINVLGVHNFLEAYRKLGLNCKVLIVGSGEEYGYSVNRRPITEKEILNPGNVYAVTKACQNMISSVYAKAFSLPLIMTRTFNHFGPGQTETFVVADFCKQIAMIEKGILPPQIRVGNLNAKRDFTYVKDIVEAYCNLILFGEPGATYNVGTGKAVEVKKILDTLLSLTPIPIEIIKDQQKFRPLEVMEIVPDVTRLKDVTGWSPKISLEEGLVETLEYWRCCFK